MNPDSQDNTNVTKDSNKKIPFNLPHPLFSPAPGRAGEDKLLSTMRVFGDRREESEKIITINYEGIHSYRDLRFG